jgi:aminopeptidase YwaD
MFKRVFETLEAEVSGDIAYNCVAEISRHHRIQASPGLRDAAGYAVETWKVAGLDAEVVGYPADGEGLAWSSFMFKEWDCFDAELRLVEPPEEARFLARWGESKLSLIQRSHPTPPGGVEAEVVYVGKGEEEKDYKGLEVAGRMVLTDGNVARVHKLAVEQRGAIGLIYYGTWVREPDLPEGELDDALKYTSFWWAGGEKPAYGFVLTPREGRRLRDLVEGSNKPVKVRARVVASLYEGRLDNAVATIPGESEEEVVVVAHICHPQPSCNDNASGSGSAMEAARALNKLITEGRLTKPRRTLKFTLVPEMSGSYAYLAANEADIPGMVAAVNLDMVGEKQCVTGGSFIVERTPESLPSYVNSVMAAVFKEVTGEVKNLGGSSSYALFRHTETPFSGGSDHYVYSDPSVGVGCPMLIQWPDKFWHTSYDTMDKVDPEMLRRAALVTATYAYFIASAGPAEAAWIASETFAREKSRLLERLRGYVEDAVNAPGEMPRALRLLKDQADYWTEVAVKAVESVARLAPGDEAVEKTIEALTGDIRQAAKNGVKMARDMLGTVLEASGVEANKYRKKRRTKLETEAMAVVPRRLYRGPVSTRYWETKLSDVDREALWRLDKDHPLGRGVGTLAMYWTDGARSLHEISELVRLERGVTDLEYLVDWYRLLERMGLVELHR